MAILYLMEQGATVSLNGGRVVVRKGERMIQEMPVVKLEQVIAYGNVHLTPAIISHCLRHGIEVAFLSGPGKYRGRLQPEFTRNVVIRQEQYQRAADPAFCLRTAAAIVSGKIRNMIAMVRRQRRLREDNRSPVAELEAIIPRVAEATSRDALYGHEGAATAAYFRALRAALKGDWGFEARKYRPPTDPVNALLSLGYTLLYNDLCAAVNLVGLDPYMGFFHQPRHGHAALASDLMEEHRCVIVDRYVLTALNRRVFSPRDFRQEADGGVSLVPSALKRFFSDYAETLSTTVHYPYTGVRVSYRQVIELQVRHFARVLSGDEPAYHTYDADPAKLFQSEE